MLRLPCSLKALIDVSSMVHCNKVAVELEKTHRKPSEMNAALTLQNTQNHMILEPPRPWIKATAYVQQHGAIGAPRGAGPYMAC